VAAELEVGVDSLFVRRGAAVLERRPLGSGDRIVEIGQRRAAPERECLTQPLGGDVGLAGVCFLDELLKALGIEGVRCETTRLARSSSSPRRARCFEPPSTICWPSSLASSEPRIRKSMLV
jgi:hypothetical protein